MLDDRLLDAAGRLDLLAVLVYAVGYDRLGSVLVLGNLLLGEGEVVLIFLFGPVGAAASCQYFCADENAQRKPTLLLETWLLCVVCVDGVVGVDARRALSWFVLPRFKVAGGARNVRYNI